MYVEGVGGGIFDILNTGSSKFGFDVNIISQFSNSVPFNFIKKIFLGRCSFKSQ